MRFIAFLTLMFLTACSGIFYKEIPYAEDIAPISSEKSPEKVVKKEFSAPVANVASEIERVENINQSPTYKEVNLRAETSDRPIVKEISEGDFPKIKDVPSYPSSLPSASEVKEQKLDLVSKKAPSRESSFRYTSLFTGFDDPLLISTVQEILQNRIPKEYENSRALLSSFIGGDLSAEDLDALALIVEDRAENPYPVLINFYGDGEGTFRESTIGTLLLLGLDPSLICVNYAEEEASNKAEVYLYY